MSSTSSTLLPLWKDFSYFSHQEDGIRWMLEKEKTGTEVPTRDGKDVVVVRGGFQCDDMGLGKTIQITATMANNQEDDPSHCAAGHDRDLGRSLPAGRNESL